MLFTTMTKAAMNLAYAAHHGQVSKDGVPYVFHPARVASGFTDETGACAAWLHDVLEDTEYTQADMKKAGISDEVCRIVSLLTHRKDEPYMDYVRRIAEDRTAKAVKLADLQDNMNLARLDSLDAEFSQRMYKYLTAYVYLRGKVSEFDKFSKEVENYSSNLFSFPENYFQQHSSTELGISEEARQMLIIMQSEKLPTKTAEERKVEIIEQFLNALQ